MNIKAYARQETNNVVLHFLIPDMILHNSLTENDFRKGKLSGGSAL